MTLEQAKKKIMDAIAAAERRGEESEYFKGENSEKNIRELLFAIDYALKPPEISKRKTD